MITSLMLITLGFSVKCSCTVHVRVHLHVHTRLHVQYARIVHVYATAQTYNSCVRFSNAKSGDVTALTDWRLGTRLGRV